MTIRHFDTERGFYHFKLDHIDTHLHAHPAIEIVYSNHKDIKLEVSGRIFEDIAFAIINSNIPHRILSAGEVDIIMLECNSKAFQKVVGPFNMYFNEWGIYLGDDSTDKIALEQTLQDVQKVLPITANDRVRRCLPYLNDPTMEYTRLLSTLKEQLYLSESRISHLFKEEMGISLKKYMVWCRLRRAFEIVIAGELNMYEAALKSGFYDQAHLSNAFKRFFGMSPSTTYNSRMIQE